MTTPTVDGGDEYLPCTLIYSPDHYSTYIPRCECEDALNVLPVGFDKPEPGLCHTATQPHSPGSIANRKFRQYHDQ